MFQGGLHVALGEVDVARVAGSICVGMELCEGSLYWLTVRARCDGSLASTGASRTSFGCRVGTAVNTLQLSTFEMADCCSVRSETET